MNPKSDITRFMVHIRTLLFLIALCFCGILLIYFLPLSEKISASYWFLFIVVILMVLIFVTLFLLKKQINTVSHSKKDIESQLKESQEKYKSIVENIQIGFARTTPGAKGKFKEVNSYFAQMMGYSKKELFNMPVADLYLNKDQRKEFSDNMIASSTVKQQELSFRTKDRSTIAVSVTGQAIRDEKGNVIFFDLIIDDITNDKLYRQELIKNEKLASIGTLAGGIAHDFNNILTGLYGNIALAKLELSPGDEAFSLIQDAEQSMTMATDLTQQLLIFARGGDPIKKSITIDQLVKDTAKFNLSGSKIKLVTQFDDNLWRVRADKGQIGQVITNMVTNSRQAMPDGGILNLTIQNVEIKMHEVASLDPDKYIKIIIKDSGVGITKEVHNYIFDPYFTTKHAGSGLGLATSYSIIKKHQGLIVALPDLDNGAIFHIFLPAEKPLESEERLIEARPAQPVQSAKILIMDDDEQVCNIAEKMIKHFGYASHTVHDGKDAVLAYEQELQNGDPFDLILMDLTIPGGMGGKDAILNILDIDPEARAVVISGYSNDPVLSEYKNHGFQGMLVKPFRINELKQILEQVLKPDTKADRII